MKSTRLLIVTALMAAVSSSVSTAAPEIPADGQLQRRTTHEALMQRRAEAAKKKAKKSGVQTVKPGEIKYEKRKKLGGLLERSSIICFGGYWTLVPKEALLNIPSSYRSRIDGKRTGKLVPWPEFFSKNRGWLQTHSVNIAQARGDLALLAEQVDVYKKSGRVVVAVCHNGPISVKPLKVPEAVADASSVK